MDTGYWGISPNQKIKQTNKETKKGEKAKYIRGRNEVGLQEKLNLGT